MTLLQFLFTFPFQKTFFLQFPNCFPQILLPPKLLHSHSPTGLWHPLPNTAPLGCTCPLLRQGSSRLLPISQSTSFCCSSSTNSSSPYFRSCSFSDSLPNLTRRFKIPPHLPLPLGSFSVPEPLSSQLPPARSGHAAAGCRLRIAAGRDREPGSAVLEGAWPWAAREV